MTVGQFFEAVGPSNVGFVAGADSSIDQGANITGNSVGIIGICGGPSGIGVEGFGSGDAAAVVGLGGNGNTPGPGVFGRGGLGPGLIAATGVSGIGGGANNTTPSAPIGVYGQAGRDADGVQGIGSGTFAGGAHGISNDPNGNGLIGDANNGSAAFGVWARSSSGFAGFFEGNVAIIGDLLVTGAKSAVVPFPDGSHRRLHCLESPESLFEDFGFGQLVDGQARVQLDPDFVSVVNPSAYHVFLTEYEDNNALFVTNRTGTGFDVRAKASMTASGTFSYRVVAKRKDIATPRFEQVTLPLQKMQTAKLGSADLPVTATPPVPHGR